MVTVHGYSVSEQIPPNSPVVEWVASHDARTLAIMDAGDFYARRCTECVNPDMFDQPGDGRLGLIELFNHLTAVEYAQATMFTVQHGYAGDWATWETMMAQKDYLAFLVRELGFEPAFHIANRAYHRRIVEVLQDIRLTGDIGRTVETLYAMALPSWEAGGLCFAYPAGADPLKVYAGSSDDAVTACMTGDATQWGTCLPTGVKVATLIMSAMELFDANLLATPRWVTVDRLNGGATEAAHAFPQWLLDDIDGEHRNVSLDPSNLPLEVRAAGRPQTASLWRGVAATAHRNRAVVAMDRGDFRAAGAHYAHAVTLMPGDPALYDGWGVATAAEGAHWAAMAMFLQALRLDPADVHTRFNLGKAFLDMKDFESALREFRRVVQADPRHIKACMEMGNAYREMGRYEEAETTYRQALTIDPRYTNAYINLCGLLAARDRYDEAEAMCDAALAIDPHDPNAQFNKAELLVQKERQGKRDGMRRHEIEMEERLRHAPNLQNLLRRPLLENLRL